MENVIQVSNVSKVFYDQKAVDNISFSINKGEAVAILGANGAGKTTTIIMMIGLMEVSNGKISLFQSDPKRKEVRQRIGCMLQDVSVMDGLKVKEVIRLVQSYYPNPLAISDLLALTGLEEKDWNKRTEKLSGGQKRRLNFALALVGNPDLLFFDEPTVGMDITSRKLFWEKVLQLKESGKTIIFTTHYLQEADEIAERIIMLHNGTVASDGTPAQLKERFTKQTISFLDEAKHSLEMYRALPYILEVKQERDRIVLITDNADEVLTCLFEKKIKMRQIEIRHGKLEEAFSNLVENREVI
ncbi:ABC transporter ATP-binding protein [Niallia sp. 01092]|uniref:ABC transporter ATP-binding protein n=1 Tax=unclassified Niallia TaxID=2837522 RepID=UPI003FCEE96F